MAKVQSPPVTVELDPVEIPPDATGEQLERWVQTVRNLAFPRLHVTVEADTMREALELIREIDDELRTDDGPRLPMPDVDCPTCGKPVR